MPLKQSALVVTDLEETIADRFEFRNSKRKFTKSDRAKIKFVGELIYESGLDSHSVISAFIDHVMPSSGRFKSLKMLYFSWKTFKEEQLPWLSKLFPLTQSDEDLFRAFKDDWVKLSNDINYYQFVFNSPVVKKKFFAGLYRGTSDFWRVLSIIRRFQDPNDLSSKFPLFTLRSYLACQVEQLDFLDQICPGNIVTEKAITRYENWYCWRFYPPALVHKASVRPSATNPVNNPAIRIEYENQRLEHGSRLGDFTHIDEIPIDFMTRPIVHRNAPPTGSMITLPPKMRKADV